MENNNYEEAMALLERILKVEPEIKQKETITEKNKEFLVRYSILKESSSTKTILKNIKEDITAIGTYEQQYPAVKQAEVTLQKRYNRFNSLRSRSSNPFNNKFLEFLKWWYDRTDKDGNRCCYYCGVKEFESETAFDTKKIDSKKFSGKLQIDRKDSEGAYSEENCVFACVLCNNAKSDMISAKDFKVYFGEATKKFWEHIK